MATRRRFLMTLSPETWDAMESARGSVPRTVWVEVAVEAALSQAEKPPKDGLGSTAASDHQVPVGLPQAMYRCRVRGCRWGGRPTSPKARCPYHPGALVPV